VAGHQSLYLGTLIPRWNRSGDPTKHERGEKLGRAGHSSACPAGHGVAALCWSTGGARVAAPGHDEFDGFDREVVLTTEMGPHLFDEITRVVGYLAA
jgi:hypothetical protein